MSERPGAIIRPCWPAGVGSRVRAVTTTRAGGLGAPPFATLNLGARVADDAATVAANRARLCRALGLPAEPGWLRQAHGTRVIRLGASDSREPPEADAAWTDRAGIVCAVLTADCLPVVLASEPAGAVATVHAGWRGLAGGVLEAAVAAMPGDPGRYRAWLGPAIGPAAFEVGPEVRAALLEGDAGACRAFRRGRGDRWLADLYALASRRLLAAGVGRVDGGGYCTFHDERRFFSHRRDGAETGRMATLAWLESPGASAAGRRK